jgi:serine-type D-Ala-D-Ala carboxypeptidase/endopeptidase (penicillin-binding protein 4)
MLATALTALAVLAGAAAAASPRVASPAVAAQRSLTSALNRGMRAVGSYSGADVVDLDSGQTLYSKNAGGARLPASVQKLYTTSAALLRFGPNNTLTTSVLGVGQMHSGTFTGTLYLRGGGDPTFGSAAFDRANYGGAGATVQRLVTDLVNATGIRALDGGIVADESRFDSLRGTPATGYAPANEVEGELSALAFNRGWANAHGTAFVRHPALVAGQQFLAALKAGGVNVDAGHVGTGITPPGASLLTAVHSPRMATLVALTNAPSDNFFAETLIKDLGARYGAGGTTADGAAVVRAAIAGRFGLHPRFDDGSGLARYDRTTPSDVVSLLRQQAGDPQFIDSLAVAGQTGTLRDEMRGTYAQGRCRGKTGTLDDVSNVVGYCRAQDGHTLAYAFLINGIVPSYAHPIQDQMQVALAKYDG